MFLCKSKNCVGTLYSFPNLAVDCGIHNCEVLGRRKRGLEYWKSFFQAHIWKWLMFHISLAKNVIKLPASFQEDWEWCAECVSTSVIVFQCYVHKVSSYLKIKELLLLLLLMMMIIILLSTIIKSKIFFIQTKWLHSVHY